MQAANQESSNQTSGQTNIENKMQSAHAVESMPPLNESRYVSLLSLLAVVLAVAAAMNLFLPKYPAPVPES